MGCKTRARETAGEIHSRPYPARGKKNNTPRVTAQPCRDQRPHFRSGDGSKLSWPAQNETSKDDVGITWFELYIDFVALFAAHLPLAMSLRRLGYAMLTNAFRYHTMSRESRTDHETYVAVLATTRRGPASRTADA